VPETRRAREWRTSCLNAAMQPDDNRVDVLRIELQGWKLDEEDVEIEREMLEGLSEVVALARGIRESGLPVVETGHRVVGTDMCHFTAPCSMPDESAQPSGRLLLTAHRAIFVGGARAATVPLHAMTSVMLATRDLVLVRADREEMHRFRCNSFGDAFRGAFIARALVDARRSRTGL
jgi:hypothetical protein